MLFSAANADYTSIVNQVLTIGNSPFGSTYELLPDEMNEQQEQFTVILSTVDPNANVDTAGNANMLVVTILDDDCTSIAVTTFLYRALLHYLTSCSGGAGV